MFWKFSLRRQLPGHQHVLQIVPPGINRGLQNERQRPELLAAENCPESGLTYCSESDVPVPIQSRAQAAFGVVQVNELQLLKANTTIEIIDCSVETIRSPQLVSSGKEVTCVQAYANTLSVQGIDYASDVAKRPPPMLFLVPAVFSSRSITLFSAAEKALLMASTILFTPEALPAPK